MLTLLNIIIAWVQVFCAHADPFLRNVPVHMVPTKTSQKARQGLATTYGTVKDTKWGGGHMACAPDYRIRDVPTMHVCAHRTYRCGTILAVENVRTRQRTLCRVLDRGPYGAKLEDGTWAVKIKASDPGVWRGVADLTPATSAAIGHNGFEQVKIWPVYIPKETLIVPRVKKAKRSIYRTGV